MKKIEMIDKEDPTYVNTDKAAGLARDFDIDVLLRTAYSLTHQIDGVGRKAKERGLTVRQRAATTKHLRKQRDIITAEIKRRCEG